MVRQLVGGLGAAIALGCAVVVGSSVAWSNIVGPVGAQSHMTRAAFNQVFADAAAVSLRDSANTPANREKLRGIGWKHLQVTFASR